MICTRRGGSREGPGEAGLGLLLAKERSWTSPGLRPWSTWDHLIAPPLSTSSLDNVLEHSLQGSLCQAPCGVREPTRQEAHTPKPVWARSNFPSPRQSPGVRDRCFGDTQDGVHTLNSAAYEPGNLGKLSNHQSLHLQNENSHVACPLMSARRVKKEGKESTDGPQGRASAYSGCESDTSGRMQCCPKRGARRVLWQCWGAPAPTSDSPGQLGAPHSPHTPCLASDTCGSLQAALSIMGCFMEFSVHTSRALDSQAQAGEKQMGQLTTRMGAGRSLPGQ